MTQALNWHQYVNYLPTRPKPYSRNTQISGTNGHVTVTFGSYHSEFNIKRLKTSTRTHNHSILISEVLVSNKTYWIPRALKLLPIWTSIREILSVWDTNIYVSVRDTEENTLIVVISLVIVGVLETRTGGLRVRGRWRRRSSTEKGKRRRRVRVKAEVQMSLCTQSDFLGRSGHWPNIPPDPRLRHPEYPTR